MPPPGSSSLVAYHLVSAQPASRWYRFTVRFSVGRWTLTGL
jgi:hypothetical protein